MGRRIGIALIVAMIGSLVWAAPAGAAEGVQIRNNGDVIVTGSNNNDSVCVCTAGGQLVIDVNGVQTPIPAGFTRHVRINLRGGDDDLLFEGSSDGSTDVAGDLVILTGSGDDRVELNAFDAGLTIGDDLNIQTGTGDDTVNMLGEFEVVDDTIISTGSGDDLVNLGGTISAPEFGDRFFVYLGGGSDRFDAASGGFTFNGRVNISGASGNDFVNFTIADFGENVTVNVGGGNDTLEVLGSTAMGSVRLDGSSGNDSLTEVGNTFGSLTVLRFEDIFIPPPVP